jgi:hypothetical protein
MANPPHFRAEFEFHQDRTFVYCSCGKYEVADNLNDAIAWLERHHDGKPIESIYKEKR